MIRDRFHPGALHHVWAPNGRTVAQNFADWFGDSKVRDSDGKPLVVYHGSGNLPAAFSAEARPVRYGMDAGSVAFFTDDPANASRYANNRAAYQTTKTDGKRGVIYNGAAVAPVYLSFQNPLIVDADGANFDSVPFEGKKRNRPSVEDIAKIARERGHDGLIVKNVRDNAPGINKPGTSYVAFRPDQIKSAIGNSGLYSVFSGDLLDTPAPRLEAAAKRKSYNFGR